MIRKRNLVDLVKYVQIFLNAKAEYVWDRNTSLLFLLWEYNLCYVFSYYGPIQEDSGEGTGRKAKVGKNNHSFQYVHA